MNNQRQAQNAILKFKKKLQRGDTTAANNIAATYRELGKRRRAFHWWKKATSLGDGDAWLEVGYCLQYGIGTRPNVRAAVKSYRNALATYDITEYAQEEAQYHLAIALLDSSNYQSMQEVRHLLQQASEDGDFSQAAELLAQLGAEPPLRVCRCRRGLLRRFGGKAYCRLHRRIQSTSRIR